RPQLPWRRLDLLPGRDTGAESHVGRRQGDLPLRALITFTAAALVATTVHAAGLAVRWNTCLGDGGIANASFACDTNAGSERLLASFAIPYDISYLPHGYESVFDVATA